jgi:hypothetical protein
LNRHTATIPMAQGFLEAFATATSDRMLRFGKSRKPLWNGHCGVVADRKDIMGAAVLAPGVICFFTARIAQPPYNVLMPQRSQCVTRSYFERRLPGGQYDLAFKVAFGTNGAAARALRLSKMQIWRYRHDRAPLPSWVFDILVDRVQAKVADACDARQHLNYVSQLPPKPPRRLTGCCEGYARRPEA